MTIVCAGLTKDKIMQDANLNIIHDFLRADKPLMLVLGDKGSGKTQLLNNTVQAIQISKHVIRLQGSEQIQPQQLIQVLSKHWAIRINHDEKKLKTQLEYILNALKKHDQHCLLVVDDAHKLPFSVMAALLHLAILQENKNIHLHLLLSGHNALGDKMQNLQISPIPCIYLNATAPAVTRSTTPKIKHIKQQQRENKTPTWQQSFWQKHGIKTFSIFAMISFLAFIRWFDMRLPRHPLFSTKHISIHHKKHHTQRHLAALTAFSKSRNFTNKQV